MALVLGEGKKRGKGRNGRREDKGGPAAEVCSAHRPRLGGALAVSGFCIYVSLALGLLGSALAFPFGIFVVICQRNPERQVQARAPAMTVSNMAGTPSQAAKCLQREPVSESHREQCVLVCGQWRPHKLCETSELTLLLRSRTLSRRPATHARRWRPQRLRSPC